MTLRRTRRAPTLLVGLALAGSLWFGLLAAFVRLHTQHPGLRGNVDPRFVDVGMLALNAALLVSFVAVQISRRSRQPTTKEGEGDDGTPPTEPFDGDRAPG